MSYGVHAHPGNTVGVMTIPTRPSPAPSARGKRATRDDEVPVRTRRWCSYVMVPAAMCGCVVQCSFAAQPYVDADGADPRMLWLMGATLLSFAFPFVLAKRDERPEATFWFCCVVTLLFPYDPLMMLMALCSLLARRSDVRRCLRCVGAGTVTALWAQLRDALRPADASFWHMVFAEPHTGGGDGVPIVMMADERTVALTALAVGAAGVLVAVFCGLHIRSRARLHAARTREEAAVRRSLALQDDLDNQQLADAIAAEAHDTLAHSLLLLALNASALQAQVARLGERAGADVSDVTAKAEEIRRQSAGALDEAHQIIDMLRHPQTAWDRLAPDEETALTRDALDELVAQTRMAGMMLNTWIDIRDLGGLDERAAKTAYRAVQEGLTNARRHAPGAPVSLEVTASPDRGVHVHVANPVPSPSGEPAPLPSPEPQDRRTAIGRRPSPAHAGREGAGLPGLSARVECAGGVCRYGFDARRDFHLDVTLPWLAPAAPMA